MKKKINELLTYISTNNITAYNELIYAGAKLVFDKIGVPLKSMDRNSKPGWLIGQETQTICQQAIIRQEKSLIFWGTNRRAKEVKQTIQVEEINQKLPAKEGRLKRYHDKIKE